MIARDLARCPYCRTELAPGAVEELPEGAEAAHRPWQPRRLRFEEAQAPAAPPVDTRPAPPPPPPTRPDIYRPTRSLGLALQMMFLAWMGLGGLVAAARIVEWRFVARLESNPFALDLAQAEAAYDRSLRLGIVVLVAYAITGTLFIVWLHRSYRNLTAVTGRPTRFTGGWAIGAWFVPFLNLIRPKQIVDECWSDSGSGPSGGGYGRGAPVPALLHLWWGLMISARFFSTWIWVGSPTNPSRSSFGSLWLCIGAVLEIGAAIAAFWVVTLLTRRQAERASRLMLDLPPRPASRPVLWVARIAPPFAAVAWLVLAFLVWNDPPVFAVVEGAEQGPTRRYDSYGISFEYPGDYVAAESSGYGSGPPTEQFGIVALTPRDPSSQDHVIVVEWDDWLTAADAEEAIDAVVDMVTADLPGTPKVEVSGVVYLEFAAAEFAARRFSATAGDDGVSGAVGYGRCPSGERLAGIRYIFFGGASVHGTVLDRMASLLATLDC